MKIERNSFGNSSDSRLKGTGVLYLVKNIVTDSEIWSSLHPNILVFIYQMEVVHHGI